MCQFNGQGFAMLRNPKMCVFNVLFCQGPSQRFGRRIHGFVSEHEGAPVHGQGLARLNILMDFNRFCRVDVHRRHEPARLVGPNGQ